MAVTTRDGLIAAMAAGQHIPWNKTASRTSVAAIPFSVFELAGNPGAGVLAGTSTAAGVVPTDATAGVPLVNAFTGSEGYITRVDFGSSVASWIHVYDLLFKAGAYTFNANVTLATQPSYSSRIPGADYTGTELWLEAVTAHTGLQSIRIQYLDQGGAAGDTGTIATGVAPTLGRMFRMPLAAGDSGVQQVNVVTSTVSTVGTFNVLVMRPLFSVRVPVANMGGCLGPDQIGLPRVFADSALIGIVRPDSTATGLPWMRFQVANG
jgi:hypothetical protein